MHIHEAAELACVEVGGGSVQTVLFANGHVRMVEGAHHPEGATLAFAVPGIVKNGVVDATNLGWNRADPVRELGVRGPAAIVLNDAEAAALGEHAARTGGAGVSPAGGTRRLVYICLGTGVGGAVVRDGRVVRANLFGHNEVGYGDSFGNAPCRCGRNGCLETVASGWALPEPLGDVDVKRLARLVAQAVASHELASDGVIVIGGGIARRYPELIELVASHLPSRDVEGSRAPAEAKSAAAWGLRAALETHG